MLIHSRIENGHRCPAFGFAQTARRARLQSSASVGCNRNRVCHTGRPDQNVRKTEGLEAANQPTATGGSKQSTFPSFDLTRLITWPQEKAAWDLGVEPYKCDNSRLLAECNELHLELVKQRDKFVLANTELKCRVRNLQTDKKQLEERCLQAEAKIRQLQCGDSKSKKDGANMRKNLL